MARHRRRKVLVDASVQWAIVRQSLAHWLCHGMMTVAFVALVEVLLGGVLKPWSEHWRAIWPLAASVGLSLVILLPKFIYDSFQLSNRFAGPVIRVRRVLRELAEGKPFRPVAFRKGDFWQEMAQELNVAVETLTSHAADPDAASPDHEPMPV